MTEETKTENYTVSSKTAEIMIEAFGAQELMFAYLDKRFGYKKALRASKEYRRLEWNYWAAVYEEYPELKGRKGRAYKHTGYKEVEMEEKKEEKRDNKVEQ